MTCITKKMFLSTIAVFIFTCLQCWCTDYQSLYNEALDISGENFYDSTMNHQDWLYWKKHYKGKIHTQDDFVVSIESALLSLGDSYTRYLPKSHFNEEYNDIHNSETSSVSVTPRYFKTRIPKHIKYLRIDSMMNTNLPSEISTIIEKSEDDPLLKGYIIDLRDNGGGLVKNATDIASLFMSEQVVLYAQTNKKMGKNITAKNQVKTNKPVVILVNSNTASACEVFTGAMQDSNRATVVGTTSYGKGVIQKIFKLSDGSGLHITVMVYFTPMNKPINHIGITPDFTVYFTKKDIFFRRDVQLLKAIHILETEK